MNLVMPVVADITETQFNKISSIVKSISGINLHLGKKELVKARLNKRLRELGVSSFDEYIDYLKKRENADEYIAMLDAISTNLTSFFREPTHFEYLSDVIIPRIIAAKSKEHRKIRIWSAGCSSGEEPFTISIILNERIDNISLWDIKILATDLSTKILNKAKNRFFDKSHIKEVPPILRSKYFRCVKNKEPREYVLKPNVKSLVHFARLNLMDRWPMRGPFDVIFCRNVMIYFEKATQQELVERFFDYLAPGGTFIIGHSESLTGIKHRFKYIKPTIYERS